MRWRGFPTGASVSSTRSRSGAGAPVGSGGTPPRREARSRSLATSSLGQDESPTRREGAARVIGKVHPERVQGP